MPRVLVPIAAGFEEIEAITIIDVLRRVIVEEIDENDNIIDYIVTSKDILNNLQGNYSKFLEEKLHSQKKTFESLEDLVIEAYDFENSQVISWANKSAKNKLKVNIDDTLERIIPKILYKKKLSMKMLLE